MDGAIPEGEDVMVIDPGGGNVVTVESLETIEDDIDRQLAAGREEPQDEAAAEFAAERGVDPADTVDDAERDSDETDRDVAYER